MLFSESRMHEFEFWSWTFMDKILRVFLRWAAKAKVEWRKGHGRRDQVTGPGTY